MAATKKVRLKGGFPRFLPDLGVDVEVGGELEVAAAVADSLAEQGDVWEIVEAKASKPAEESK